MNNNRYHWSWIDTKLSDEQHTVLTIKDVKQLLTNRNENIRALKLTKKQDLIDYLKQNHAVNVPHSFMHLPKNHLFVELKLRGLYQKRIASKRKQYISDILQTAQPKPRISWNNVQWKHSLEDRFNVSEIKQLLMTRGANNMQLKGSKQCLIQRLKQKYSVNPDTPIEYLTRKQIKTESKLFGCCSQSYDDTFTKDLSVTILNAKIAEHIKMRLFTNLTCHTVDVPFCYTAPLQLNENEFMIETDGYLYKYNVRTKEWLQWIQCPKLPHCLNIFEAVCVDRANKIFYKFYMDDPGYKILKINYETFEAEIYDSVFTDDNYHWLKRSKLVFVDKQVHLFGYVDGPGRHWIFDHDALKFRHCYDFKRHGKKIVHIPSKNVILKIGSDNVDTYDVTTRKWIKSVDVDLPAIRRFDWSYFPVKVRDKHYLIIGKIRENIAVVDLKQMKLFHTDIRCPYGGFYNFYSGIVVNESFNEELIVFGFARKCWNKYTLKQHRFPPRYIVKLIQSWYSDGQCLHFIQTQGYHAHHSYGQNTKSYSKHLKISVSDILEQALKNNV
eukprot:430873_1